MWCLLIMLHSKVLVSFANRHWVPDELPMDGTDRDGFFSTRRVCTVSNSTYNTTDSSLIIAH